MTLYVHDGIEFDLDRAYVDVVGVEWRWTGQRNPEGEPLMLGAGPQSLVSLPDVYRDHGPLIPMATSGRLTADMVRDALIGGVTVA